MKFCKKCKLAYIYLSSYSYKDDGVCHTCRTRVQFGPKPQVPVGLGKRKGEQ